MKYKKHNLQKIKIGGLPFIAVQGPLVNKTFSSVHMAKTNVDLTIQHICKQLDSIKYGMKQIAFYQHQEKNGVVHRCRAPGRFHFGHVKVAGYAKYLGTVTFEEALETLNVYALNPNFHEGVKK